MPTGPLKPLATALVTLFGSGSWTIPILLGLLAWRFLRHPDSNADTARMVIGWTALLVGVLGLVHVASGTPELSAGLPAIRSAGGVVGFAASAPLVALITKWAAIPVLALDLGLRPAGGDRDAAAPRSRPDRRAARVHPAQARVR